MSAYCAIVSLAADANQLPLPRLWQCRRQVERLPIDSGRKFEVGLQSGQAPSVDVNNNNIRLIRRCQNATCYNDMDKTVKKREMTEVLDC